MSHRMNVGRVLVTGASGFIGRHLCAHLIAEGIDIRRTVRNKNDLASAFVVGDINPSTDWRVALSGVDTVVHLAARAHHLSDAHTAQRSAYTGVNVDATLALARQSYEAGVTKFVFLSTLKVNGERTLAIPYTADASPNPAGAYSVSKWEAEQGLASIAKETGLPIVIIRPPLVYGPNVRANFLTLMNLVKRGVPLPFGAVENRRSLIYVANLVDLIKRAMEVDMQGSWTLLASDDFDVSTPELIKAIAHAMGKEAMLPKVSPEWLVAIAKLMGKKPSAERLLGSLQADIGATKRLLNWIPPFTFQEGISATVSHFLRA